MFKKTILFTLVILTTAVMAVQANTQRSVSDLNEAVSLINSKVPNVINQAQASVAWANVNFPLEEGEKYEKVNLWINSIFNQDKSGEEVAEDLIHNVFREGHNQGWGYFTVDPSFITDDPDSIELIKWMNLCAHLTEDDGIIKIDLAFGWLKKRHLVSFKFSESHFNFRFNMMDIRKFEVLNLFLTLKYNDSIFGLNEAVVDFSIDINGPADATFIMKGYLGLLVENGYYYEDDKEIAVDKFRASIGPQLCFRYIAESEEIRIDEGVISGLSMKAEFEGIDNPALIYDEKAVTDFNCELLIPFNPIRFFIDKKFTFQINDDDPITISYARLPLGPVLTVLGFWPIPLEIKEGENSYGINMWDLLTGKYDLANGFPLQKIEGFINWLEEYDEKIKELK